jgi:hypothetical protein
MAYDLKEFLKTLSYEKDYCANSYISYDVFLLQEE